MRKEVNILSMISAQKHTPSATLILTQNHVHFIFWYNHVNLLYFVAGVRMKYPSCYVLLCEMEDTPTRAPNLMAQRPGVTPGGLLTPPTSPAAAILIPGADPGGKTQCAPYTGAHTDANTDLMAQSSRAFSARITEKVTQDNLVTAGIAKRYASYLSYYLLFVWN